MQATEQLQAVRDILLEGEGTLRERLLAAAYEYRAAARTSGRWPAWMRTVAHEIDACLPAGSIRTRILSMDEQTVCETADRLMDLIEMADQLDPETPALLPSRG